MFPIVVGNIRLDSVSIDKSSLQAKRVLHLYTSTLWVIFSSRGALRVTLLKQGLGFLPRQFLLLDFYSLLCRFNCIKKLQPSTSTRLSSYIQIHQNYIIIQSYASQYIALFKIKGSINIQNLYNQ